MGNIWGTVVCTVDCGIPTGCETLVCLIIMPSATCIKGQLGVTWWLWGTKWLPFPPFERGSSPSDSELMFTMWSSRGCQCWSEKPNDNWARRHWWVIHLESSWLQTDRVLIFWAKFEAKEGIYRKWLNLWTCCEYHYTAIVICAALPRCGIRPIPPTKIRNSQLVLSGIQQKICAALRYLWGGR